MQYFLIVRQEAVEEMKAAYLYYESITEGLGERFLSELHKDILKLLNIPRRMVSLTAKRQSAILK